MGSSSNGAKMTNDPFDLLFPNTSSPKPDVNIGAGSSNEDATRSGSKERADEIAASSEDFSMSWSDFLPAAPLAKVMSYCVNIPDFGIDRAISLDQINTQVTVSIWDPPDSSDISVRIPDGVNTLHGCTVWISSASPTLDPDALILELINLGFGKSLDAHFDLPMDLCVGGQITSWNSKRSFEIEFVSNAYDAALPHLGNRVAADADPLARMLGLASYNFSNSASYVFKSPAGHASSVAMSPMSNFGSPASFMTASSPASFMTARSAYTSPAMGMMSGLSPTMRIATIREEEPPDPSMPAPLQKLRDDYYVHLHRQKIVQPFDKELNWSGKGQHVTFLPKDSVPVSVLCHLGASMTAKVDKVLCRRIAIARKTMRCSRQWTVADALREVYHLQNLSHAHIIQLVGTYLQGRNFSILMYPAADCHLGTFLEDIADSTTTSSYDQSRLRSFLLTSLGCMASALAYVHNSTTKHMDIKPQNILVRLCEDEFIRWRIYLADFGLSRSFASQDHSQTDGPTSRTPRYCAPEVYQYESRGRSADIFSLGCVYTEVLTVLAGDHPTDFADFRRGDGTDESFHANLPRVTEWLCEKLPARFRTCLGSIQLGQAEIWLQHTRAMICEIPEGRPSAQRILQQLPAGYTWACCMQGPEPYVAYHAMQALPQANEASRLGDVREHDAQEPQQEPRSRDDAGRSLDGYHSDRVKKRKSIADNDQSRSRDHIIHPGWSAGRDFHQPGNTTRHAISQSLRPESQTGDNGLEAYQLQLMLLEQQNKKRLLMARQEQDRLSSVEVQNQTSSTQSPPGTGSHALQDYQLQLLLLEQQKKKRKLMEEEAENQLRRVEEAENALRRVEEQNPAGSMKPPLRTNPILPDD
ncbi:kinase-like domain-containing protein [Paraphoma chrysanthemicola]|nr:kinase-like domain-containing protein [Paraphoma chrysanthemicola]